MHPKSSCFLQSTSAAPNPDLVFDIPKDHEEVIRLEKEANAPLAPGNVVTLLNGEPAVILEVNEFVNVYRMP